ncbi:MAG: 2-amino-4-hydroxy-6-hydroxymethyldihydropteridine diphosphokinase [Alphaproteobacteria bacterium]|nr:MAG: 2-amino-4-hydroxy-6-hydroxymethyldihydropteridine diphosphokinase [Alphaproteobacteria bacterium]
MTAPRRAWLGLGGNVGDVAAAMVAALERLDADPGIEVVAVSALYRTPPWGVTDQPDFLNACAELRTTLAPERLLAVCLDTERALKRVRDRRWGPRTIDLDVLVVEAVTVQTPTMTLPHPRMLDRPFVLLPLAELAPDLLVGGRAVRQWLAETDTGGIVRVAAAGEWWRH